MLLMIISLFQLCFISAMIPSPPKTKRIREVSFYEPVIDFGFSPNQSYGLSPWALRSSFGRVQIPEATSKGRESYSGCDKCIVVQLKPLKCADEFDEEDLSRCTIGWDHEQKCIPCRVRDWFVHSGFSFLYEGARLGSIVAVNDLFLKILGSPSQLNIGAIFSFDFQANTENDASRRVKELEKRIEEVCGNEPLTIDNNNLRIKLLRHKKIENEKIALINFCRKNKIEFDALFIPMKIDENNMSAAVAHIKEEINKINRVLINISGKILITGDISMNRTVVLFSCWLISQGWSVEAAIRQSIKNRLEHRNIDDTALQLIKAFAAVPDKIVHKPQPPSDQNISRRTPGDIKK